MKHLKYILILALSSAMGTLQAQDLKELMKENRENREANYAKWGPTSDHNGMGYVVRAGFVLGGTTPLPLPKEIRKINEFAPKGGFSLGIDGYKYFNTKWGLSAGLRFFMQGMRTGAEVKNYNMAIVMGEDVVEGRFTGTDITTSSPITMGEDVVEGRYRDPHDGLYDSRNGHLPCRSQMDIQSRPLRQLLDLS